MITRCIYTGRNGIRLLLTESEGFLISCLPADDECCVSSEPSTQLLRQACSELDEYFSRQRKDFTVPLKPEGTEFQLRVIKALQTIAYGARVSYADVAAIAGKPTAVRATASAIAANRLLIFIPCHRVVRKNGELGQYRGGTPMKSTLLEIERS